MFKRRIFLLRLSYEGLTSPRASTLSPKEISIRLRRKALNSTNLKCQVKPDMTMIWLGNFITVENMLCRMSCERKSSI